MNENLKPTPYNYATRCLKWALHTFTSNLVYNTHERCARFIEEAFELVQALGFNKRRILAILDTVYDKPKGEPRKELGDVMNTLALLAITHQMDENEEAQITLEANWLRVEEIRAKNDLKSKPYLNDSIRGSNPDVVIYDFDPLGR